MTTNIEKIFFDDENNVKVIDIFLRVASNSQIDNDVLKSRLLLSKAIVEHITMEPTSWDEKCQFNIKYIGDKFIQLLHGFNQGDQTKINNIYIFSYRFLCEYDFFIGAGKGLNIELNSIKDRIESGNAEMDADIHTQIHYASYVMPINMLKKLFQDLNIGVFKDFEQNKVEAENLKNEWDTEMQTKTADVGALRDSLETYKIGFNFVGLNKGFLNLANKKAKEALSLFWSLIGMGVAILVLLIFGFASLNADGNKSISYLIDILPIISIEIVLIYFFRIILLNHRSVKAQIMQIELRQALCQFIQSYVDYSHEIKKRDKNALEKFENLIFSGILSNPEKLPSTFDGMKQISEFMKNVRGQ